MNRPLMRIGFAGLVLPISTAARSCDFCRPWVEAGVYNADFLSTFVMLAGPLVGLLTIGLAAQYLDWGAGRYKKERKDSW